MSTIANVNVIQVLNEVLAAELAAINQYFMHAEMCGHWGFAKLHDAARKSSVDEMRHAESLIERILDLGGSPSVHKLGAVTIGKDVLEQFRADHQLESQAIDRLRAGVTLCQSERDFVSAKLLEDLLASEEQHLHWLETQQHLVSKVGEQNYLAQQL